MVYRTHPAAHMSTDSLVTSRVSGSCEHLRCSERNGPCVSVHLVIPFGVLVEVAVLILELCNIEISDLQKVSVARDEDVVGLEVSMNDTM